MAKSKNFNLTEEQLQTLVWCLRTDRPTQQSIALQRSVNAQIKELLNGICSKKHLFSLGIVEHVQSNFWTYLTLRKKPIYARELSHLVMRLYKRSTVDEYRFSHPRFKKDKEVKQVYMQSLDEPTSKSYYETNRNCQLNVENRLVHDLTTASFLQECLEQLEPDNQIVLKVHWFEGVPIEDLAAMRQLTTETLKQRIRRNCMEVANQKQNQYTALYGNAKTKKESQSKVNTGLFHR
jgi:DNA-directed RNA polymerase specialized sigma24 family protein